MVLAGRPVSGILMSYAHWVDAMPVQGSGHVNMSFQEKVGNKRRPEMNEGRGQALAGPGPLWAGPISPAPQVFQATDHMFRSPITMMWCTPTVWHYMATLWELASHCYE
ncbi:hypothetical protein TIFTF001_054200, partial [Ficus carica]